MLKLSDQSSRLGNPRAGHTALQLVVSRLVLKTVAIGAAIAAVLVGVFHAYLDTGTLDNWLFLVATAVLAIGSWSESRRPRPRSLIPLIAMLVVIVARLASANQFVAVAMLVPLFAVGMMGTFSLPDRQLRIFAWVFGGAFGVTMVSYALRFEAGSGVWPGIVAVVVGAGLGTTLVVLLRRENRRFIESYQSLYDGVSIGLVRLSVEGRLIAANRQMTQMLGYPSVGGLESGDVRSIVFDQADLEHAAELVRSGESGELKLRHRVGTPVWVRVTFGPISDTEGDLLGYDGFVEDLTESRRVKASAVRAEARFTTAFDSAPIGMALVDTTGAIIRANQAFSRLAGQTELLPVGTQWASILDGQLGNAARFFDPGWSGDDQDFRVATSGGQHAFLRLHVAHPVHPGLETEFAIVQLLDVTSHIELESVLRGQVEAKNDFIATVSHELRTPLTAVIGFLDELPGVVGELGEEPEEMLEIISSEATSLANIVEDLLVAARADIDQLVVRKEAVDVAAVVERVVRASSRIAGDHEASIDADAVREVVAEADGGRVEQIIWNLLTNALRHGGKEVAIGAERRAGRIEIWVRDNGAGIPHEAAEALFEPFRSFSAGNGVTTSMGLGLHVAQKLAQLMGGSISANSDRQRTEFVVDLPAAEIAVSASNLN